MGTGPPLGYELLHSVLPASAMVGLQTLRKPSYRFGLLANTTLPAPFLCDSGGRQGLSPAHVKRRCGG
eukprot:15480764-Alexandrium_andersonii.AAC.1